MIMILSRIDKAGNLLFHRSNRVILVLRMRGEGGVVNNRRTKGKIAVKAGKQTRKVLKVEKIRNLWNLSYSLCSMKCQCNRSPRYRDVLRCSKDELDEIK